MGGCDDEPSLQNGWPTFPPCSAQTVYHFMSIMCGLSFWRCSDKLNPTLMHLWTWGNSKSYKTYFSLCDGSVSSCGLNIVKLNTQTGSTRSSCVQRAHSKISPRAFAYLKQDVICNLIIFYLSAEKCFLFYNNDCCLKLSWIYQQGCLQPKIFLVD